jgi:replication factor C subunit 3/5
MNIYEDSNKNEYLPWIEKYRPKNINDIISHDQNIQTIKQLILNSSLPHLLFYGCPGTGKTSTIMAVAKEIYGNNIKLMVMKLDASDDRGINSVRDDIKGFAEKTNMFQKGVKLIILDEADAMTFDAQFALRRIIEKYSESVRFCLICNYENKIISAIRSRCANFRFNNIDNKYIINKLKEIILLEKLDIDENAIEVIATLAKGDLRKAINLLQTISMQNKKITIEDCYDIACIPQKDEITYILSLLFDEKISFNYSYEKIIDIIKTKGYSLSIILKELIIIIINNLEKYNNMPQIISDLSDLENMVNKSTFEDIYISTLIGIFKKYY